MTKITKNIFISLSLLTMISLAMVSCETEDNTGYSTLKPSSPSIAITTESLNLTLTEGNTTHQFTVTLSEPQIVDVKLYINQVGGTADADDFTVTPTLVIPAGSTTATGEITILSDEVSEEAETLVIQVGDQTTGNASLTPVSITFNIANLTSKDLVVDMSWETNVLDAVGMDLAPADVVDLRMLLINSAGEIVSEADGASFESITLMADSLPNGDLLPDGVYTVATDIYSTINAGDFNETITLDLQLDFNQLGIINGTTLSFPAAMTNTFTCSTYRVNLATIEKTGATYTINKALSLSWSAELATLAGSWAGVDSYDYASQTVTSISNDQLLITGLATEWISDFWGEEVLEMLPVTIEIDWNSHGEFTIPEQPYMTTLYEGDEYPYTIVGHGSFRTCGGVTEMTIEYNLLQDGFDLNEYLVGHGYAALSEELTLNANAGLKSATLKSARVLVPKIAKPNR